jgi:hypothetical protein
VVDLAHAGIGETPLVSRPTDTTSDYYVTQHI